MKLKNFALVVFLFFSGSLFAGDVFIYISLKNDNKIAIYKLDTISGSLQLVEKFSVAGGPAAITIDSAKKYLYIAQRSAKSISTFTIDPLTGKLSLLNTITAADDPVNLALDKTNKFLLSAYYNANKAAIYPITTNGTPSIPSIRTFDTGMGTNPHAIHTDPSNRFLYISNKTGDKIQLYQFNAITGDIAPATIVEYITPAVTGPRHFVFHSKLPLVYFSNETGNSASVYNLNQNTGTLTHLQTISTLPSSFSGTNTVADVHLTKDERFLYVSNRGHNSIAAFSVNASSGLLTLINQYATVSTPRAFNIDPTDNFLFAAGETSADLATYRINPSTGELSVLGPYLAVGNSPVWIMAVEFENIVASVLSRSNTESTSFTFSPNPHSSASVFSFQLNSGQKVNLAIFNSLGNPVKTIVDSSLATGKHSFPWDGTDDSSNTVPSGVYTALLHTPGSAASIKLIVP